MHTLSILRNFDAIASSFAVSDGPTVATGLVLFFDADDLAAPLDGDASSTNTDTIFKSMLSCFILCVTPSSGMPIFSILRYLDAIFSSSLESCGAVPAFFLTCCSFDASLLNTALIIFSSTPSIFILCRTPSAGTPMFIILRYLDAMAFSLSSSTFTSRSSFFGCLLSVLRMASMILDDISSDFILCCTASRGMPILIILRYFNAIFSSSLDSPPVASFLSADDNDADGAGAVVDFCAPSLSPSSTALIVLASTPSMTILCRTASRGTPICTKFLYLLAAFSSITPLFPPLLLLLLGKLLSETSTSTSSSSPRGERQVNRSLVRSPCEN
mmetsp:Transcript_4698/g.10637  ORF Transcript_4698/g.10637 Transcript_4698/m.10637 type:complete len:329 (+) Transcript_4698:2214-3200(+)